MQSNARSQLCGPLWHRACFSGSEAEELDNDRGGAEKNSFNARRKDSCYESN
jgi:hypothetical protein